MSGPQCRVHLDVCSSSSIGMAVSVKVYWATQPICAELSEISLMCVAVNVVNKFLFGNSIVCLTGPRELWVGLKL